MYRNKIQYQYKSKIFGVIVMQINQKILAEIKKNNNMITTAQVVALGFSRALLSKYVKELEGKH